VTAQQAIEALFAQAAEMGVMDVYRVSCAVHDIMKAGQLGTFTNEHYESVRRDLLELPARARKATDHATVLVSLLVQATGAYTPVPACHCWIAPAPGQTHIDWQDGRCAGCNRRERKYSELVVDHCHRTGIERGLLCRSCNISEAYSLDQGFWQLYRERPPTVICKSARVYGRGAHDTLEGWVFRALGPVPEAPAEMAAYLAAAAAMPQPGRLL
jgi:hypothetical protein